MQLKENKTIVEGRVERIEPSADGWGAEAEVRVDTSTGQDDFLKAAPGSVLKVFVPDPAGMEAGQSRRMTITVLGGPKGQRAVVQDSEEK